MGSARQPHHRRPLVDEGGYRSRWCHWRQFRNRSACARK
jgi:hypothetical protein